jgi:Xaa-Pro aminopeptidase
MQVLVSYAGMPNLLLFGDDKQPAVRNELGLPLPDPVGVIEINGTTYVLAGLLDVPRLQALGTCEVISFEELGLNQVLAEGKTLPEASRELVGRACERLGLTEAVVPGDFPLELADSLRERGVTLRADGALFDLRRRSKTPSQLAGIRRALKAAEFAMAHVRDRLRDGGELTAEGLRAEARRIFVDNGCVPHDMLVIAAAGHGADPHDEGSGAIPTGVPVVVDIFPRDMASGCWGDITRTFCVGEPPAELVQWHRVVREAQRQATDVVRPGISAGEPYHVSCDVIEAAGYPTRRTRSEQELLREGGYVHYLGHGVGLDLHEAPTLDDGGETLVPGDVITIEPGLYRPGFGGCRIEDIVLVTDDGYELVTAFPYELS